MHHHDPDPVPVRIVRTPLYDGTPEADARLAFDAWVARVFIVLAVLGHLLY